jgi:hypothetical protein
VNIVNRFTFNEWTTFMDQYEQLGRKTGAIKDELTRLLGEPGATLIIDDYEWKRWANIKSIVR